MNKIVVEKLKGHSQTEIDIALKCLDLDELTLIELPNYENSITDSLNFIANKMLEFLKFREHVLAKKTLHSYFISLCPYQIRFNNTLKKLPSKELELLNNLNNDELIIKAFNEIIPKINYDLIIFTSHFDPLFISYFNGYKIDDVPVALSNLNNKELELLFKAYGKNLDQAISSKNVNSEERKIIFNELFPKITKYLTNIELPAYKFNLSNVFKELKIIGIETVALQLPEEYRNFIFKYFNKDFNSYKSVLEFSKEEYEYLTNKIIPLIKSYAYNTNVEMDYTCFLNFWNGRTLEQLAPYLIGLNKKEYEFLVELYGKNLEKILNYDLDDKQKNYLKKVVGKIKTEIQNNPEQKDIIKIWDEIKKGNSTNILKMSCCKVNGVYKNIIDEFFGKDLENILTPKIENLTIDELWKLNNTIFTEIKESIKLYGSGQLIKDLKEANKYFIDGVFKDYDIVKLLSAVAKLAAKDIGTLKDMYGVNLNRPLLTLDKNKFNDLIYDIFPELLMILESKDFEQELAKDMYLFNLYPSDINIVRSIVNNLKEEDLLIVKKLYGENLEQRLSFNNATMSNQEFLSFRIRIIQKIKVAINNYIQTGKLDSFKPIVQQKSNSKNNSVNVSNKLAEPKLQYFYKIFGEEEEVKEKVNKLLTQIPDEYIILLKKLYGETLQNPICQKNVSMGEYSKFYGSILPKLTAMFNGISVSFNIHKLRNNFYNYFMIEESSKESFLDIINNLEEEHKNIIFNIYGENLDMFFGTMRVNSEELHLFYNIIIPNIQLKLQENKLVLTRKKKNKRASSYGKLLKVFGDGKEQEVKAAIAKLPEKYQLQLKVLYGENYDQDIIFSKREYNNLIQTIIPKLRKIVDGEEVTFSNSVNKGKKSTKYSYFYRLFGEEPEVTEKVQDALKKVPEEKISLLKKMYGEDLEQVLNRDNITDSEYTEFRGLISKIKDILDGKDVKFVKKTDYSDFYKIFGEEPDVKEKVQDALKKVPEEKICLLKKVYGENLEHLLNHDNVTDNEYTELKKLVNKIKDILEGKEVNFTKSRNYSYFFDIFNEGVEDKDKQKVLVKEIVRNLPDKYKIIITAMYGEDLDKKMNFDTISKSNYSTYVKNIVPKIEQALYGESKVKKSVKQHPYLIDAFSKMSVTNEQLVEAINKLPEEDKLTLKKHYGNDYIEKLEPSESEDYENIINLIIPKIKKILKGNTRTKRISKNIYLLKIFGEEKEQEVKAAILKLPEKYQIQLKVLYGENYDQDLKFSKKEYDNFRQTILPKLKTLVNGEEVSYKNESKYAYLFKIFGEDDDTKEVVKTAILQLPEKHQNLLKNMYGENHDQKMVYDRKTYNNFNQTILPKLQSLINGEELTHVREGKYSEFYRIFGKKEEVKEIVDEAVKLLPEECKLVLKRLYGENLDQKLPPFKDVKNDYRSFTRTILPKLKRLINGEIDREKISYGKETKYSEFYRIFGKKEEVKEIVDEAVLKLPEKYLIILKKLYGDNLDQKMSNYNELKKEYVTFIGTILPKLQALINGEEVTFGKVSKYKYFYKIFGEQENIVVKLAELVNNLNENHQRILKNTYGDDLNKEANFNNISKSDYSTLAYTIIPKIKEGLSGKNITITETKYTYFLEIFGEDNTKERIIEIVNNLSEKHQDILYRLYGSELNKPICRDKITDTEYSNFVHTIIKKIKNELEGVINTNRSRYTNFYSIFGAENNQALIKSCVLELNKAYQDVLVRLYGKDFNEEMNYNRKDYDCLKNTIIPKITKLITNSASSNAMIGTDDQFKQNLLNIYYNPLFVQLSKMLPEKDCLIWVYYWGYNDGKRYTIEELVNLLNVTNEDVLNSLKKSATLISNTLEYVSKVFHVDELAKLIRLKD
ncbi:MAG: hypothetical protein IJO33_01915 [Bacilli bacterium]|nr:hypothetical protein [Bacilli bacterium]